MCGIIVHTFSEIYIQYAGRFIVALHRKFYFLNVAARKINIFSKPEFHNACRDKAIGEC